MVFPRILLFFCFYRITAGLLTLLISGFSLASSCKSENKYRNNEDMKVHFYQVSCYFTVILNVSISRCKTLCTSRTFSYQSQSFQKEIDCCWVFSLAVFKRTMLMVIHIFKSHNVVFPKALPLCALVPRCACTFWCSTPRIWCSTPAFSLCI